MKKILVFDMDGTLLDSMNMWRNIQNELDGKKHLLKDLDPFEVNETSMLHYAYGLIEDKYDNHDSKIVYSLINRYLEDFYSQKNLAKPHVMDALKKFKDKGFDMYIATATDYRYASIGIKSSGLDEFITEIYTPDTVGFFKNDLSYFKSVCKNIGTEPENIIYFDDATFANRLANEIGFTTIGVFDEYYDSNENNKKISDKFIYNFKEIEDEWLD